jgi:Tol biopolymer transport system component
MTVASGTHFGRYEIRSPIGSGGMGEVYRARDPKLGRDVAVKVLPAALSVDAERLRRFEQEAQATGSLNHPNILAIHDIGTHDSAPYIVSELLEGETLRGHMDGRALPARKAIDYALQIARGLAAAHARGIVHRDLKPENIFVTRDGHIKILDFGLAKLVRPLFAQEVDSDAPTLQGNTMPGQVMGTVGYMSPEQVRGEVIDHRTDIFAFGTVLYEMLSGKPAFHGKTAVETLNAILKEEPPELTAMNGSIPPALERVLRHCLEKNKEERFQSARDLSFDLEALSGLSTSSMTPALPAPARVRWRLWPVILIAALLVAVTLVAFFTGRKSGFTASEQMAKSAPPEFQRLTFRRGTIASSRFAPDGQTIIYSAAWEGEQLQLFLTRPESPESRPLGLQDAILLGVSSSGEMAILLHPSLPFNRAKGTLARMPMAGGAPREVLRDVRAADWSPDGKQLAVIREVGEKLRLEYPIGKVLYETTNYFDHPRVSPKGDLIAFIENWNNLTVIDLAGKKSVLSSKWGVVNGLSWSPEGDEIWFTASEVGWLTATLYAITLSGQQRLVARGPQKLKLDDISRDGQVLLNSEDTRKGILALPPGETEERDLSWLDWGHMADISDDGKVLLFTEAGEGGRATQSIYLRKIDGSPAVRLGEGEAQALSPDGEWVLSILNTPSQLVLLPVGAGESKPLTDDKFNCLRANWFPDGKRILAVGNEPGQGVRSYILNIEGGGLQPITPEGVIGRLVSPDGKLIVAGRPRQNLSFFPVEGGEPRPVPGFATDDDPIQWSADGRSIYVRRYAPDSAKVQVYRLDLATGRRELWKEFVPDPTRIARIAPIVLTPDGKSYAYTYVRHNADLYLVKGLK